MAFSGFFGHTFTMLLKVDPPRPPCRIIINTTTLHECGKNFRIYSLSLFPPVGSDRVLVFVETKRNADFLACLLSQEQFPTTSIHG